MSSFVPLFLSVSIAIFTCFVTFRPSFFPVEAKRPGRSSPNNVVFRHYHAIMDEFVTKSPKPVNDNTGAEKNAKRKTKFDDKEYDSKRRKRVFQTRCLQEFSWLTVDAERGVMKCKICCSWPAISDPRSPLVLGSDRF